MIDITVESILSKTVDIKLLLTKSPEIFDFSKLSRYEIVKLLEEDVDFYYDKLKINSLITSEKIAILTHIGDDVRDKIEFTEKEILDLKSISDYYRLLQYDFKKYANKEKLSMLSQRQLSQQIIYNPQWFIDNNMKFPRITLRLLAQLSYSSPEFVDLNLLKDIHKYSTSYHFWIEMIKFNNKYKKIFLNNINRIHSKTDIRAVINAHPSIIKLLTNDILTDSKLNFKEWVLLSDTMIRQHKKIFKNWAFSDEIKESLKLDLTVEVISGDSTATKRLRIAMKTIGL